MNGANQRNEWRPSRREAHLEWYLQRIYRYIVGTGTTGWWIIFSNHDPFVLLLLVIVSAGADVLSLPVALVRQAQKDKEELDRLIDERKEKQ